MKKILTKIGITTAGFLSPLAVFAAEKDLDYVIQIIIKYFNIAVYLIIGLAIVMFTYNIFRYFILGNDNPSEKKEAGLYVMWSIIGFFVILSMWGLVKIVTNTFDLDSNAPAGYFGSFNSTRDNGLGTFGGSDTNLGGGRDTFNPYLDTPVQYQPAPPIRNNTAPSTLPSTSNDDLTPA